MIGNLARILIISNRLGRLKTEQVNSLHIFVFFSSKINTLLIFNMAKSKQYFRVHTNNNNQINTLCYLSSRCSFGVLTTRYFSLAQQTDTRKQTDLFSKKIEDKDLKKSLSR